MVSRPTNSTFSLSYGFPLSWIHSFAALDDVSISCRPFVTAVCWDVAQSWDTVCRVLPPPHRDFPCPTHAGFSWGHGYDNSLEISYHALASSASFFIAFLWDRNLELYDALASSNIPSICFHKFWLWSYLQFLNMFYAHFRIRQASKNLNKRALFIICTFLS